MRTNELHFKLLIPVWGESYLKRFFDLCSKSLFSEENILLLNSFKSYEIVFLTTKDSEKYIHDYFKNKHKCLKVTYIDDLLKCNSYGIILTLAYTRGVLTSSTNQLDTAFMFLNADFLLSNNTIELIIQKLNSGYNGVLAIGYRCIEDESLELIKKTDLSPRSLVDICLKHMHPTMAANIINQDVCYNTNNLAIHLKTESSCILTISFNPNMLCIKPEVELKSAEGYCDFYFVPAMLPSGNYYYVCDSDEMFMLEIAPEQQEKNLIVYGSIVDKNITNWLSLILMEDKLKYANYVHVMHNLEITEDLSKYKQLIKTYFDTSISSLPQNYFKTFSKYNAHPFWIYPVHRAIEQGLIDDTVKEINIEDVVLKIPSANILEAARKKLIQAIQDVQIKYKLKHIFAPDNKTSIKSILYIMDVMPMHYKPKKNITYINVREFLNLSDITPILQSYMNKDSVVKFVLCQLTFDFYKNKIKKFIYEYKDIINIEINLTFNFMQHNAVLKYISSLYTDVNNVLIKVYPVTDSLSFAAMLKYIIKKKLFVTLKILKIKIYPVVMNILYVLEKYMPAKCFNVISYFVRKIKYKIKKRVRVEMQINAKIAYTYNVIIL